jgi:hypothetical protein
MDYGVNVSVYRGFAHFATNIRGSASHVRAALLQIE